MLFSPRSAITRFTSFNGQPTVTRLALFPRINVFLFQDPAVIAQIWKQSQLLDFRPMATHFFQSVCGMPKEEANLYLADNTGNQARHSTPENSISDELRVHHKIFHSDREALTGSGFTPTLQRYRDAFTEKVTTLVLDDWTHMDDFWKFIQDTVGAAEIDVIFGPKLLYLHPNFVREFFEFDAVVPLLMKGMSFGRAERIRHNLLFQLRTWQRYAKKHFTESSIYADGDGDPFWGSAWTRSRHQSFTFFSDDAMSSHDLGVAWGSMGNTVPCALMALLHVLRDPSLLCHLRQEVDEICGGTKLSEIESSQISSHTLLSAIYAETLRLNLDVYVPVVPLHGDLSLGKWRIPKGSTGLINSGVAHMNTNVWNTKGGTQPVKSFWAERFIVDPKDPTSGSICPEWLAAKKTNRVEQNKPYFSTDGLEGSWVPYGGGQNRCPGRFLAKGVITFTLALLCSKYDIEFLTDSIPLGKDRVGMGVQHPTRPIPFRIRKRTS